MNKEQAKEGNFKTRNLRNILKICSNDIIQNVCFENFSKEKLQYLDHFSNSSSL